MKSQDIMEAVSNISEDWIEEAAEQPMLLPEQQCDGAAVEQSRGQPLRRHRFCAILGVAASLAVISAVLPNLSRTTAYALQSLPIAGAYFRLVTVRDYTLADSGHTATVKVGEVQLESQSSAEQVEAEKSVEKVNAAIQQITDEQIAAFREELRHSGYSNLELSTEVVTDSDAWYSVCLTQVLQNADSAEAKRYFTIRKRDGKLMQLGDLFAPGSDYVKTLSEEVKRQMQTEMAQDPEKLFFLDSDIAEDNFKEIKKDQSFYVNSNGKLVICFDEGEVAPMSEGSLQFVMPESLPGLTM